MNDSANWAVCLLPLVKDMVSQIEEFSPGAEWLKDRLAHCVTHNYYGSVVDDWDYPTNLESTPVGSRSRLFGDIPTADDRREFLRFLADHFQREAHFRAHYGRFLSDNAPYEAEFEASAFLQAQKELDRALSLAPNDATILHMRGMCPRRLVKRLINRYGLRRDSEHYPQVLMLVEEAHKYFAEARQRNSAITYPYISEIQMLRDLIDGSTKFSRDSVRLLAEREDLRQWLDDAFRLADQAEKRFLISGDVRFRRLRGDLERLQGDYQQAIQSYSEAYQRMKGQAGASTLLRQVAALRHRYSLDMWLQNQLPTAVHQLGIALRELGQVLQDRPQDLHALALWFEVYTLLPDYSPETAQEMLERYHTETGGSLEATFGLMCIWFVRAAQGSPLAPKKLLQYQRQSAELAKHVVAMSYIKYWLGKDWRLLPDRIVPRLPSSRYERDTRYLLHLDGYVYSYQSPTFGTLRVGDGEVETMFQPGRKPPGQPPFTKADAEKRTPVTCVVAFAYDRPRAWDVSRHEHLHHKQRIA